MKARLIISFLLLLSLQGLVAIFFISCEKRKNDDVLCGEKQVQIWKMDSLIVEHPHGCISIEVNKEKGLPEDYLFDKSEFRICNDSVFLEVRSNRSLSPGTWFIKGYQLYVFRKNVQLLKFDIENYKKGQLYLKTDLARFASLENDTLSIFGGDEVKLILKREK